MRVEHFIREYRPGLTARLMPSIHRVDRAILPTRSTENCSDALRRGTRPLRYFHGRSSLSTWLRAVPSQRTSIAPQCAASGSAA